MAAATPALLRHIMSLEPEPVTAAVLNDDRTKKLAQDLKSTQSQLPSPADASTVQQVLLFVLSDRLMVGPGVLSFHSATDCSSSRSLL